MSVNLVFPEITWLSEVRTEMNIRFPICPGVTFINIAYALNGE